MFRFYLISLALSRHVNIFFQFPQTADLSWTPPTSVDVSEGVTRTMYDGLDSGNLTLPYVDGSNDEWRIRVGQGKGVKITFGEQGEQKVIKERLRECMREGKR